MKYFGFMPNDFVNGQGLSVSVWMAGCPFHCPGCHNQQMWNYEDGYEVDLDTTIEKIKKAIVANGIQRNLSMLGGEPLASYNREYTLKIIQNIKEAFPQIKVYVWTGYVVEDLLKENDEIIKSILKLTDVLIDGQFDKKQRDITLPLRGSRNQRVLDLTK